jgi:hypothetical protein
LALNIFRSAEEQNAQPKNQYADVVGSFRAGYSEDGQPKSLDEWRVTTGDPVVADAIHALLGGEKPAEWETKGEECFEVYTEAKSVTIVLEGPRAIRQRFVQRNRNNEIVYTSDGAMKDDGERDPHASLPLDERLKLASDGLGPALETTIWFRLDDSLGEVDIAGEPARAGDLGKFRYSSTGKSIGKQVDRDRIEQELEDYAEDNDGPVPVRAKLTIEHVSFVAKSGPRAGKTVEYNTAAIKLLGPAK